MTDTRFASALVALALFALPSAASAQVPACTGSDAAGASAEFEAGNALMEQALNEIRGRHIDRARARAGEALVHFDRQCELGDVGALAERGAALMLMGEALRSAQSYDAFLAQRPLETLDARARRRTEANLQPGIAHVALSHGSAHLFIDDLDFGALPRATDVHVPLGDHRFEARDDSGAVLATASASFSMEAPSTTVDLLMPELRPVVVAEPEPTPVPVPVREPEPAVRTDYTAFYALTGALTAVGLGLGIAGIVAADERASTYNSYGCPLLALDCEAVLSERDIDLGLAVGGFVLGGLAAAGLVAVIVIDAGQAPREHVRVGFGPGSLRVAGSF